MICHPCRVAGDYPEDHPNDDALAVELAQRELHSQCPGATSCTCQHRDARAHEPCLSASALLRVGGFTEADAPSDVERAERVRQHLEQHAAESPRSKP